MRRVVVVGWVLAAASASLAGTPSPALLPNTVPAEPGFQQNWFGPPLLPAPFEDGDSASPANTEVSDGSLPLETRRRWVETPPAASPPPLEESQFPKLLAVVDLEEWRRQEELRRVRETAGDLMFGLPLLVPQLVLEEFLPRGVAVGPRTYLYRTSKDSRSMPLVVFDQAVFHEGEFLAQAEAAGAAGAPDTLTHLEKHVLRRSLMSGFRATYTLPNMSLDLILETAAEQGVWGYLLVPAAGGALLFLKGLDQKFVVDDVLKARVVLTSGRQWMHSARSPEGLPAISCELQFFNLPVSVILSMDMSNHGMSPQFVGLGTSLGVVEDLVGIEQARGRRPQD